MCPVHSLDYEQRRRKRRRRVVVLMITCALCWPITKPLCRRLAPWAEQVRYLRHQASCLQYTLPPDRVILESDPQGAAALVRSQPHYKMMTLAREQLTCAVHDADPLGRLVDYGPFPIAFLHQRRAVAGNARLVIVWAIPYYKHDWAGVSAYLLSIEVRRAAGWRPRDRLERVTAMGYELRLGTSDRLRIFAGTPDPRDPAHFVIPYEVNGIRRHFDGWLRADDTVILQPREDRQLWNWADAVSDLAVGVWLGSPRIDDDRPVASEPCHGNARARPAHQTPVTRPTGPLPPLSDPAQ